MADHLEKKPGKIKEETAKPEAESTAEEPKAEKPEDMPEKKQEKSSGERTESKTAERHADSGENSRARSHVKEYAKKNTKKVVFLFFLLALSVAGMILSKTGRLGVPAAKTAPSVIISEVMAENEFYLTKNGSFCDWIELQNTTGDKLSLAGYGLSDEEGSVKYTFPKSAAIPAGGYYLVWCDPAGGIRLDLSLTGGTTLYLTDAQGGVLDSVKTVGCAKGQSEIPGGKKGKLLPCDAPTPGYANDLTHWAESGKGGELQLSEIMTSNSLFAAPDGGHCSWVEIHNTADGPVALTGYRLTAGDRKSYTFPNVVMPAGGYLVVWCRENGKGMLQAPFALSENGDETVSLCPPGGKEADSAEVPAVTPNHSLIRGKNGWTETDMVTPGFSNDKAGFKAYRAAGGTGGGGLAISEVMAKNKAVLADGDGDFSDWIELHNDGSVAVSLKGWYLSDDEEELKGWAFPETTIEPDEYLVVFASGKNRTGNELHTDFSLSPDETVFLVTPDGEEFSRMDITGLEDCRSMKRTDTDECVSTIWATPGFPNTYEGYIEYMDSSAAPESVIISEAAVNPADGEDWVELRNNSGKTVDLSGWTMADKLTDAKSQSLTGQIAPGEYITVECTAFGLNAQEDQLYLYDDDGKLVDYVYLHDIPAAGSMGRKEEENGFFLFDDATPGSENWNGIRLRAEKPKADVPGGVYREEGSLTVTLSAEGTIYYTTDGSTPGFYSETYTEPIEIYNNTVLRAVAVADDAWDSEILTCSYLLDVDTELPVVSLAADPEDLFGREGIYSNHETAWEQKWTRTGNVSFFEEDGEGFSIDCGLSIHGRTSRRNSEKRSFTLKFKNKYGGKLNYDVFGDGVVTEFSSLLLRASLEDNYTSYMRDELFARLAMDYTEVPAQNYRYAALYINGEYWGLYAIREHHSENYFASHYGVDADTVDMQTGEFKGVGAWGELLQYAGTHSLADPDNFSYVESLADIDEIIDWLILECWSGDIDVYENVRFYASPEYDGGRYVFGLTDMDLTMMNFRSYEVGFENEGAQVHTGLTIPLLQNSGFRDRFLTRLGESLRGYLSDENVLMTIDEISSVFSSETAADLLRWDKLDNTFDTQMEHLVAFTSGRCAEMVRSAQARFGLNDAEMQIYFEGLY